MNADFFNQLISMALVASFGFYLARKQVLTDKVRAGLSTMLIDFILPFTVLNSFDRPYDPNDAKIFLFIIVLSFVLLVIQSLVAWLLFRKNPLEMYAATFSNKGYVGIPVINAVFGPEAVFFVAPVLVVSSVYTRLYGRYILLQDDEEKKEMRKEMLKNNTLWAFIIGLALYSLRFSFPGFLAQSIRTLASLNTPISMLVLGAFASDRQVSKLLSNPRAYLTTAVRNLLLPFIILLLLLPLPEMPSELKMVMAMIWACPTAMDTTIQAQVTGRDTYKAAQMVVTSTILYLLTMPFMYGLAAGMLGYVG